MGKNRKDSRRIEFELTQHLNMENEETIPITESPCIRISRDRSELTHTYTTASAQG